MSPSDNEDDDQVSTDSYEDSLVENEELGGGFDSVKYLSDALNGALSGTEFHRSMALQAQTSGQLKSKEVELQQLQNEAEERLSEYKIRFKQGIKLLSQVSKDLKWARVKADSLEAHFRTKYPIEFAQAREKVISPTSDIHQLIRHDKKNDDSEEEIYI